MRTSVEQLKKAYQIAAEVGARHGDAYLPVFRRLHNEMEKLKLSYKTVHILAYRRVAMNQVIRRGERFYFNRRVAWEFRTYDPRTVVRVALKTDSRKEALRLAVVQNEILESYWRNLALNGQTYAEASYQKMLLTAQKMGFNYIPNEEIAASSLDIVHSRLSSYRSFRKKPEMVSVLLGGVEVPRLELANVFDRYISFSKGKTLNKSANQLRKMDQSPQAGDFRIARRHCIGCGDSAYHHSASQNESTENKIPQANNTACRFALDAFKACPNGYTDYADRPDSLSGVLSKYLRKNKLLPTDQHTVYSLRHSFQDRLLAANAPDRVQADLMGHKFQRQAYCDGASLSQKLEWLEKVKLKPI